jgi:tRNA1(Val) A37 N6-methylase TrmN6
VLLNLETNFNLKKFAKPDFFANYSFVEGLVSSEEFRKKGMQVFCLNQRMIYPMYGVYMPTSQEYLNLFSNYVSQVSVKDRRRLADLGCGSGILPIILKENGGFKGKVHCFDSIENAVDCAKMNMELYGLSE